MGFLGLGLIALVGITLILTGLPSYAVLIFAAVIGVAAAVLTGSVPLALLSALPTRLINLLESDLLQALPLYVLIGVLLNRMTVGPAIFKTILWLLPRRSGAPVAAGLGLGALLGPMSGSVGASVLALSKAVDPSLRAAGLPAPLRQATIAVASTLGVVVPPSLVLILLGDAMLTAHTFALNATGRADRVINTQDVLRAAIVPAALFLCLSLVAGWLSAAWSRGGTPPLDGAKPVTWREIALTLVTVLFLVLLLGGVATGRILAVEGAATGAFVLFLAGLVTGHINVRTLGPMLTETMATTGTLFSPLLAATTFTLVLRLLSTDKLIEGWVTGLPGGDLVVVATILGAIFAAAFVLDAFEIIFVAVPILIPPLLIRVPDAVWVSSLVLLTLQASFLLPPLGYALILTRGMLGSDVRPVALPGHWRPSLSRRRSSWGSLSAFQVSYTCSMPRAAFLAMPEVPPFQTRTSKRHCRRCCRRRFPARSGRRPYFSPLRRTRPGSEAWLPVVGGSKPCKKGFSSSPGVSSA
jgi:TRAP-type mannitol/chloroaromatic compound transport system permease large subunit